MTKQITRQQARDAARQFVRTVSDGRDWGISAIEANMPSEYRLDGAIDDADFHPVTIGNVADAIYRHARFQRT